MSTKEEKFDILDDVANRILISDVVSSNLLLNGNKTSELTRNIHVLSEKNLTGNIIKKEVPTNEVRKAEYLVEYSLNCSVCQNLCKNCKNICVTCKSPCSKCAQHSCKNSSTDTDDFDKYLESLCRKIKVQPKVKTTGTDTCDLEGHFDYYKLEKKTIRIQKHVATDCSDLNLRRPVVKKPNRTTIGVDTSDLASVVNSVQNDDSDCEFYWNDKEDPKTYSKKPNVDKVLPNEEKICDDDISENSLVIDEDVSMHPSFKEEEANKENVSSISNEKDVLEDVSTSEESDVDLATASKVSKCRSLAKKHNITLKNVSSEKEVIFRCSICSKTFQKKYLGILHLGCHIDSDFFKCLSCSEKFTSLDLLYSHVKETHISEDKKEKKSNVDVGENKENSESDPGKTKVNKIYKCAICPSDGDTKVEFSSFKALLIHKKEKHGIEPERKVEKRLRIKREFICLLCGKQFKSSKALKDHSPVHTGEKNYHCDICNKSYTTSANLKIHKKTHTGTKDFVCSVCGKAFHKKDSLKVHFRKHSGERPFQCDLCPMKFDRNYILKNHRYTHFAEKTFICPVCGKTFTTHGGLNNHEKGHRKDPFAKKPRKPAVKPTLDTENAVICDVCGKIYSTKNNLRIHKFVHLGVKPFECTICHQTYAKKDSMLIHMRKHTDERPFACQTCGMTFYRNHTLKTHLLRHTGERPHKCKMCGKSFTQSSSLTYHIKNHDKKVEKKKAANDDPTKQKRKRVGQGNGKLGAKKIPRILKPGSEFHPEGLKLILDDKKSVEVVSDISKDASVLSFSERGDIIKGGHFMLPVSEKEVLIVDKGLGVELARSSAKEIDFFSDKDAAYVQPGLNKFNYYIAKSHVFSPKEVKPKGAHKETEISIDKNENDVDHLIISKGSFKEGNVVTIDKGIKEEFVQIDDQRLDIKPQVGIPLTGEILNAAFISDENGEVIPLSSMTLQGLNAENIMISPVVAAEGDDRKGFFRNPKFAVFDSKITYNIAGSRLSNEKSLGKGNGHVIHLKDSRIPQRIQLELDPHSLHIQAPVVDDGTLHGIPEYYGNVQPNGM